MNNMLQLMVSVLNYIDSGKIFKQPISWVYKSIAICLWGVPLYMLYLFFDQKIFDLGGSVVFGFLVFLLFVTITVFFSFQLWWLRSEDVKTIGGLRGDFFTIPIVCHITRTLGECVAIVLSSMGIAASIVFILFAIFGNKGNMYAIPFLREFINYGIFSFLVGIVSGFFVILVTRFFAEMIGVMAAIANNTKNMATEVALSSVPIQPKLENTETQTASDNILQVDFSKNLAPITDFVMSYWKGLFSVLGVMVAGFVVYTFFIKSDPVSDGKKIANKYCDCQKEEVAGFVKFLKHVDENFDDFHFKNSHSVKDTIDVVERDLKSKKEECILQIEQEEKALGAKYASNNMLEEFERQLNIFKEACVAEDKSSEKALHEHIEAKAKQLKTSAPEIGQIKNDLINKNVQGLWYFSGMDNFIKDPEIISETIEGEDVSLLVYCNVIDLGTGEAYDIVLQRKYYRVDNENWRQGGLVGLYVGKSLSKGLLSANKPLIIGRWKYDTNVAEYFSDGTWTTTFDGQTSQGTWKISNEVLELTLNGSPYASMRLIHPTKNLLTLTSNEGEVYSAKRISNGN